jgi:type IV pilus assembly protein PilO
MPRNFSLGGKWNSAALRDPRVMMRVLIGVLLAANLAMAVVAFKPFGGSADDLRAQQASLQAQLIKLQLNVEANKKKVENVQIAREQGDQFLTKYFMDERTTSSQIDDELLKDSQSAGIKQLPASYEREPIEGSDTLEMLNVTQGLEGTYENLTKYINLLDKSPRFLIVDGMETTAPLQNGKMLSITIKIRTFARAEGATVL